ncbi:DNA mismatch repair ATPase msh1 [Tulasnella sp. 403]|nr:DNA mismatch repair ATPase msh1 [Tulasnella sp. 403]
MSIRTLSNVLAASRDSNTNFAYHLSQLRTSKSRQVPSFDYRVTKASLSTSTARLAPPRSSISEKRGAQKSPPKRTRTRKRFDELPTKLTGENGEPAAPLDSDWRSTKVINPRGTVLSANHVNGKDIELPKDFKSTPVADVIAVNRKMYPHCILLTRVGNFYESYFDQAEEVSKLLNATLTTKRWGGKTIDMCGFPLAHLNRHLKHLVQEHKRFVAICEEFKRADGTFERYVTRVVTPGTLIDEDFLNDFENNYLLAIEVMDGGTAIGANTEVSLAWCDVAVGEFSMETVPMSGLRDQIARLAPREVVLHQRFMKMNEENPLGQVLREEGVTVSFLQPTETADVLPTGPPGNLSATPGGILLIWYLQATLLDQAPQPERLVPSQEDLRSSMQIDAHTIKALEIRQEIREGGTSGSLLNTIRKTKTAGGARLLERRLCSPSTDIATINSRQALVALFVEREHLRSDLLNLLKHAGDATRIVQKFTLGKGDASDLVSVSGTIESWELIRSAIKAEDPQNSAKTRGRAKLEETWAPMQDLLNKMTDLRSLAKRIDLAVDREGVSSQKTSIAEDPEEGQELPTENGSKDLKNRLTSRWKPWTIRPTFSQKLSDLHEDLQALLDQADMMEGALRKKTGAQKSLTLEYLPNRGWYVRIRLIKERKNVTEKLLKSAKLEETMKGVYSHVPWTQLGESILSKRDRIYEVEKDAFATLRKEVDDHSSFIRQNARVMDELDVAMSFASLRAGEWVRPTILADSGVYDVENGRHPTVERGLWKQQKAFIANSVKLDPDSRLHIITGPNMAGKSTLLRQTALIAILAQTGSFVPATKARLGIVDKVFSRIGAKDDLYRDRSTFMVEMLETAEILNKATERSLVIVDEVGRGTTVKEGVAIAFATAFHLYDVNKCRTLFATHFHDIADMLGYNDKTNKSSEPFYSATAFYCTNVSKTKDGYTYSYTMRPGVNRDSHGLMVAQMAGMPEGVLRLAKSTMSALGHKSKAPDSTLLRTLGTQLAKSGCS